MLTEVKQQQIIQAMAEKNGDQEIACPMCKATDWEIQPYIGIMATMEIGVALPMVMGVSPCGYTIFINLIVLGLADLLAAPSQPALVVPNIQPISPHPFNGNVGNRPFVPRG